MSVADALRVALSVPLPDWVPADTLWEGLGLSVPDALANRLSDGVADRERLTEADGPDAEIDAEPDSLRVGITVGANELVADTDPDCVALRERDSTDRDRD